MRSIFAGSLALNDIGSVRPQITYRPASEHLANSGSSSSLKRLNRQRLLPPRKSAGRWGRRSMAVTAQLSASANVLSTALLATVVLAGATLYARLCSRRPALWLQRTTFNLGLLSRCPTLQSMYKVTPFMLNGHIETIFAAKLRRSPDVTYQRKLLHMEDGGTVALDYHELPADVILPDDAPVVILLPGLTGGSHDSYVRHMVGAASRNGVRAVVFNSRGTSDGPVTSPQFYSASYTGDLRRVVEMVQADYPHSELLAVGWSLGANILVRYLAEEGDGTPLSAGVSLCNPFDMVVSDNNFHRGFNRIYDVNLAKSLRNIYKRHAHLFKDIGGEYQPELAARCRTIREFDDAITRVSFGWPSVDAYYAGSSSSAVIADVTVPLLCIQAADDPIAPEHAIPYEALLANPNCILAVTPAGGHLGWVSGTDAPLGAPWCTQPVVEWLNSVQLELLRTGRSKRMREQLSERAGQKVAGKEALNNLGQLWTAGNGADESPASEEQAEQFAEARK